jgi:hypothetical protein
VFLPFDQAPGGAAETDAPATRQPETSTAA